MCKSKKKAMSQRHSAQIPSSVKSALYLQQSYIFIDLSKAFDRVDHSILLKKLELYDVTDRNHLWFKNYLSNRKQFIQINIEENTELEAITLSESESVNSTWQNRKCVYKALYFIFETCYILPQEIVHFCTLPEVKSELLLKYR